jgi:CDGSH-type Zn-finger protein
MGEPHIAEKRPAIVELEPGTYWWCACGRSKNQPFCDGSHKGSEFSPIRIDVERAERMALCQCKRTGNAPRCDGSHRALR